MKDRLILFGVAGLAAVATAGWMRQPVAVPVATPAGITSNFQPPVDVQLDAPLPVATAPHTATATPARSYQKPVPVTTASSRSRRMPVAYDDRVVTDDRPATVEHKRSTGKSIAIIGGSAAAGAAIGGLAGGGKGAAIGALSGGAAGAVYDRMTAKKEVPADDYRYRQTGVRDDDRREGRSTAERVAIIGGGAATGAAIGGLAGGGKGAAIGAIGGGAAGYVYDRMTRDK
jgi:hypothetical protein